VSDRALHQLATVGGACGLAGTLCYIIAAFVPMGDTLSYAVVMLWPILSIVFSYSLCRVIGASKDGAFNQLAFVFACLAFTTVAAMISVQLAVRMGMAEPLSPTATADRATADAMLKSLRLVDLGLDVAWDFLIGTTLILLSVALGGDARFGKAWGAITGILGLSLIALNAATFPWPPDTRDLFDLGPFIGLFIITLSARLMVIGLRGARAQRASLTPSA
jgi:hypothetical protein